MILVIHNPNTGNTMIRSDIPNHRDIQNGYPFIYVDDNNVKYYMAWYSDIYNIAVVVAKKGDTDDPQT